MSVEEPFSRGGLPGGQVPVYRMPGETVIYDRVSAEQFPDLREGMHLTLRGVRYRVGKYLPQQDAFMLTYLGGSGTCE